MTLRSWNQWKQWKHRNNKCSVGLTPQRQIFSLCGLTDILATIIIDSGNWLRLKVAQNLHHIPLNWKMTKNCIKQMDGNGNLIGNTYCIIMKKMWCAWCKENMNDRQWQKLKECIETFKTTSGRTYYSLVRENKESLFLKMNRWPTWTFNSTL